MSGSAPTGHVRGTSVYKAEHSPPGSDAGFSLVRRQRFPGDVIFNSVRDDIIKNCFSGDKVIKLYLLQCCKAVYSDSDRMMDFS